MSIDTVIGEAIHSSMDGFPLMVNQPSSAATAVYLPSSRLPANAAIFNGGGSGGGSSADSGDGEVAVSMFTCFATTSLASDEQITTAATTNAENVAPLLSAFLHENSQINGNAYGGFDTSAAASAYNYAASIGVTAPMLSLANAANDAKHGLPPFGAAAVNDDGRRTAVLPPPTTTLSMSPTSKCGRCETPIDDRCFMLIGDRSWHIGCVRCAACSMSLDAMPTCFLRDGALYCRRDYAQKFTKRCERCAGAIGAGELVMNATRDKTFHLYCFSCAICGRALRVGETYFLGGGGGGAIFCQMHSDVLPPPPPPPPPPPLPLSTNISASKCDNHSSATTNSSTAHKRRHLNVKCTSENINSVIGAPLISTTAAAAAKTDTFRLSDTPWSEDATAVNDGCGAVGADDSATAGDEQLPVPPTIGSSNGYLKCDASTSSAITTSSTTSSTSSAAAICFASSNAADCSLDDEFSLGGSNKAKRMRTSFKHHQLRTMKAYFNLNHNPDAKDLKQLAQKTGLTKRVLQVWFQNARAKFRRSQPSHRGDAMLPRCGGGSDGGSPSGVTYAMELHMLSNSMDFNGINCGTTSSLSARTSLSPEEESSMYDVCSSFADDSVSSVGAADDCASDGEPPPPRYSGGATSSAVNGSKEAQTTTVAVL